MSKVSQPERTRDVYEVPAVECVRERADLRSNLEKFDARTADLNKAVEELEAALNDQKSLRDHVGKDPANTPENRAKLSDAQKKIGDQAWSAGNRLFNNQSLPDDQKQEVMKILRGPLSKAADSGDDAQSYLRDGDFDLAQAEQAPTRPETDRPSHSPAPPIILWPRAGVPPPPLHRPRCSLPLHPCCCATAAGGLEPLPG